MLGISACDGMTNTRADKAKIELSCRANGMRVDLNLCLSGDSPGELKIKSGDDVKTYVPSEFLRFGDEREFLVPRLDYELFVRANGQRESILRVEVTRRDGSTIRVAELTEGDAIHLGSGDSATF